MLYAYQTSGDRLIRRGPTEPLAEALWIDLYRPQPPQIAAVAALGIAVPTLADMEEIEISNRLYRENGLDYMTVVIPGQDLAKQQISGPVTFILAPGRLITVRHHAPRPFETYAERADRTGPGCATADQIFLGLIEEITGRLADLLEGSGRSLDEVSRSIFRSQGQNIPPQLLQGALEKVGRQGELLGNIQLALLTLERALSFYGQTERSGAALRPVVKSQTRDIAAMEVHADFLSQRVALVTDATLGMINLTQNATVRIVSVVAVLFLPPTLVASVYGMNFAHMPELSQSWGYPAALILMVASAAATYLWFRWKNWL
ncbi:magnesium transporter [Cereibacter changlensis JA139]|uniref:Magnesium transport protein CorA n=2 Tax=Cereibacter changlensis TaxID=402884 RepID=A0A2T4JU64_9RHOB|nr:magnesium transporter CorA family protein [Cereibacter changlensis]PTE21461.1 magnesium transporter [Cereibacter changlensis JA139]PZX57132.1 magnesium transporter [Cereibacter changlensis]